MGHPVVSHQILPRTFSRPLAGFAAPPAARAPRTWRAGVPPAENEGKKIHISVIIVIIVYFGSFLGEKGLF